MTLTLTIILPHIVKSITEAVTLRMRRHDWPVFPIGLKSICLIAVIYQGQPLTVCEVMKVRWSHKLSKLHLKTTLLSVVFTLQGLCNRTVNIVDIQNCPWSVSLTEFTYKVYDLFQDLLWWMLLEFFSIIRTSHVIM